ncbi:MAG: Gfo/Idh/MocA family oxidoreductase, partial [Gemmatimonas sp.]
AIADHDAAAQERARLRAPHARLLSADALIEHGDVDAVLIATPTDTHADIAARVATAGKHMYLEKPIAASAQQAEVMRQSVQRSGVHAVVGFNRRHHPIYRRAKAAIRDRMIGRVYAVHSVFAEPAPATSMPLWKRARATGGGVLLDLASHHVDSVRWLLDQDVATVSAQVESRASEHDIASITLSLRDGTLVQGHYSFRSALADTIELHGELGVLRLDRHRQTVTLTAPRRLGYGTRTTILSPFDMTWQDRLRQVVRPSQDPSYAAAWRAFVDLMEGRPSAVATIDDGMASLAVVLAAESAVLAGVSVRLAHV